MSEVKPNGKLYAASIIFTPLIIMLLATVFYFSGVLTPSNTVNKGQLILPTLSVNDFGLKNELINKDRQWLIIQTSKTCEFQCQQLLHLNRQVHVALGKEVERVKRVVISQDENMTDLVKPYPGLNLVEQAIWSKALTEKINLPFYDENYIFIADPNGNVMLYFDGKHEAKDLKKDLKKMLKLSNIG